MNERDLDVITIGSIMAEISPDRHSVRVTEAEMLVMAQAGSATTFALACARLGGCPGLIARVGNDEVGRWIVRTLANGGVNTNEIRAVAEQLTPVSLASVDAEGNKTFSYYRFSGHSNPLETLDADDVADDYLSRTRIFDLTESSLRSPDSRVTALELARRAKNLGCLICVNPNLRPTAWKGGIDEAGRVLREAIELADFAIMNGEEAMLVTGCDSFEDAVQALREFELDFALITNGEEPTRVATHQSVTEIPAVPVNVQFDIGAGDTFHAAFLAHWTPGSDLAGSARFASHAAALKIQRPPTIDQLPTRAEVEHAMAT